MAEIRHVGSWRQNAKTRFSQKLSNLELWCLWTTYRKLCKLNWAFQRTHYWIPIIQDGWDPPSWKSTWRHYFLPRVVRFGQNFADCYRMTCRLRWCVEMETRCRIPIWRTFGRIQWHVIPEPCITLHVLPLGEFTVTILEPHVTLQGAVTWRNQCRDRATLQGLRIPSGILNIVFRHILFFCF